MNLLRFGAAALLVASSIQAQIRIVSPANPSPLERLAAREVRRYFYLRTGQLLPVLRSDSNPQGQSIVIARNDRALAPRTLGTDLGPEQYVIRSDGRSAFLIGGDDTGALYAAYRFAEHLGVRFYLHGDVIPDRRIPPEIPAFDEKGKPLFDTRGLQPFHDFPEGPDWWDRDDYLAYIAQLPKLRMNFLGLHNYPEGGVGPEPGVWIGEPGDLRARGAVAFSYPSQWANTARKGMWGYAAMKTSEFSGGANLLFESDDFGPVVMRGLTPSPATPEDSNKLFNQAGEMFRAAFAEARSLGVKTCIGTETPLTIPKLVQDRLKAQGKDPKDLAVVQSLYEGMFRRIAALYPVDYYWLWTPEGWTWGGNKPDQFDATVKDMQAAVNALRAIGKPFTLATSGWVLGPQHDRAALDRFLPKDVPMSCINRQVGHAPDEPGFANIQGRPKWVIPWLENDPNLSAPQPWVGRMRYDAVDARRLGCTGLLGIHWRTRILAANIAALAAAAWDQSWVPRDFDTSPILPEPSDSVKPTVPGAVGGSVVKFAAPVAGTDEAPVYQTVRYNMEAYNIEVPDGVYKVTLKFNEPNYNAAGKRVFGVKLQGKPVIDSLDIFARAGKNKALDFTFSGIPVTDGWLRIAFEKQVEYPAIAGIVVEGKIVRKINCGGAAYLDYEADSVDHTANPLRNRTMPVDEFYVDFARASFGDAVAQPAGLILAGIDGVNLPEPATWQKGPGGIKAEPAPWTEVKKRYAFVDDLAALRTKVEGPGNLERFDYWLNTYRYMAALAEAGCLRGELDKAVAANDFTRALPVRISLARAWERIIALQIAATGTPGELGTLVNLEQHNRGSLRFLGAHDDAIAKALGKPLPESIEPAKVYCGPARIIVPTVRTLAGKGESLNVKVIAIDQQPFKTVSAFWRPLGEKKFRQVRVAHVARAVYAMSLPPFQADIEYYIQAETVAGKRLVWPVTAPDLNQTVVVR